MRLRYVGQHETTETFGKVFYRYKWTNGSELSAHARETLAQNPQFEVEPLLEATAGDVGFEGVDPGTSGCGTTTSDSDAPASDPKAPSADPVV